MAWTSRRRVVAAIEHREADRVPIDFNPVPDFYLKLKEYLGLEIDEELKVGFMEEAIPHPEVLDALGAVSYRVLSIGVWESAAMA